MILSLNYVFVLFVQRRCPVFLFLTIKINQLTAVSVTLDTKENDARGVSYASLLLIAELHARARSSIPKKIWLSIHPIKNHVIIRAACLAGARLWKSAQQYGGNCGKTNNKHHFQKFTYFKSLSLFFVAHCG